jgi:hypothetical protein
VHGMRVNMKTKLFGFIVSIDKVKSIAIGIVCLMVAATANSAARASIVPTPDPGTVLPAPIITSGQTQTLEYVTGYATTLSGAVSESFGSNAGPSGTFSEFAFPAPYDNPFGNNYLGFAFNLYVTGSDGVTSITIPGFVGFSTAVADCLVGTCSSYASGASSPTSVTDNGGTLTFSWSTALLGNSGLFIVYVDTPYFSDPPSITITGADGNSSPVTDFLSPSLTPTPVPAALPLFATGLGAMGLLGWRRKRKSAAALAPA